MSLPRQPQLPPQGLFRPAVASDADVLHRIYLQFPAALSPHILHGRGWVDAIIEDGAQVMLSSTTYVVIGLVAVWRDRPRTGAALTLFLHPDFHRNGRGRLMVERAIQMARHAGFDTLRAYVYRSNEASYQFFLRVLGPPDRLLRGQSWDAQYVFEREVSR